MHGGRGKEVSDDEGHVMVRRRRRREIKHWGPARQVYEISILE